MSQREVEMALGEKGIVTCWQGPLVDQYIEVNYFAKGLKLKVCYRDYKVVRVEKRMK
jgi:hypothetical protein